MTKRKFNICVGCEHLRVHREHGLTCTRSFSAIVIAGSTADSLEYLDVTPEAYASDSEAGLGRIRFLEHRPVPDRCENVVYRLAEL